jgi:hypothetical protein
MQMKSKIVEVQGRKFSVRKLQPEVGSFIFMRMLGARMRAAANEAPAPPKDDNAPDPGDVVDSVPVSGEMQVRALTFAVFSGDISFTDFKFIQTHCMQATSIIVNRSGTDFPMPVMSDTGSWTKEGEPLSDNVGLVMQLTTETLVFCF